MALMITDDCNGCSACEPECPNSAIIEVDGKFAIDPSKCTECMGHYDESQCVQICPVACIRSDPEHSENKDKLFQKYARLTTEMAESRVRIK